MSETLQNIISRLLKFSSKHSKLYLSLTALISFAMFFFVGWNRLDPDFGWHLVTGQYILHHGVPKTDIFTYTAKGFTWVDHEWGNDVILALANQIGGYLADTVLFALVWTASIMLWVKRTKLYVVYLATLAMLPYTGIRPVAWTILLFSLLYYCLEKPFSRYHWLIPLFFLPWANLHAGFIAGLALIGWYALIKLNWRHLVLLVIATALTFINPYGLGLYKEIVHTLFDSQIHNQIAEWRSFSFPLAVIPYTALWIVGFICFTRFKLKRWFNLGLVLFLAALSATRNFPLFVIATTKEFSMLTSKAYALLPSRRGVAQKIMYGLSCALLSLILVYCSYMGLNANSVTSYPYQAVSYLKTHPCPGNLLNSYDYGGFLIWKLPGTPDYIDGRMVTWVKYMNQYESLLRSPAQQVPLQFKKYNIKCALLEDTSARLITYLSNHGWKTIQYSNGSVYLISPST